MSRKNYKFMEWLLNELPVLREKSVLEQEASERLDVYYRKQLAEAPSPQKYLSGVLSAFGALLIGLGLVLLVAFNWDMLPKIWRLGIAFLPLLAAAGFGIFTIAKDKDHRWREASAVISMAGVVTLTSLVSQIYHLDGTLESFMRLILLVTLPLLYIFRSYAYAIMYCIGIFFLARSDNQWLNFAYFMVPLPFLIWNLRPGTSNYQSAFARWLLLPLSLFLIILMKKQSDAIFGLAAFSAMFYSGGMFFRERGVSGLRNPWLFGGWLGITLLLLFGWGARSGISDSYFVAVAVGISLLISIVFACIPRNVEKIFGVIAMVLFMVCAATISEKQLISWFCHGILLALGTANIIQGVRRRRIISFNAGMLQVALLAYVRFFSDDFDLFWRAIGFMTIGVAFVVANIILSRKIRNYNEEEVSK